MKFKLIAVTLMLCALNSFGASTISSAEETKNKSILIKTLMELRQSGHLTSALFDYIAEGNRELEGIRHQMLTNGRTRFISPSSHGTTSATAIEESKNKAIIIKTLIELEQSGLLTFELFDYIAEGDEELQMLKHRLIKNGGIRPF